MFKLLLLFASALASDTTCTEANGPTVTKEISTTTDAVVMNTATTLDPGGVETLTSSATVTTNAMTTTEANDGANNVASTTTSTATHSETIMPSYPGDPNLGGGAGSGGPGEGGNSGSYTGTTPGANSLPDPSDTGAAPLGNYAGTAPGDNSFPDPILTNSAPQGNYAGTAPGGNPLPDPIVTDAAPLRDSAPKPKCRLRRQPMSLAAPVQDPVMQDPVIQDPVTLPVTPPVQDPIIQQDPVTLPVTPPGPSQYPSIPPVQDPVTLPVTTTDPLPSLPDNYIFAPEQSYMPVISSGTKSTCSLAYLLFSVLL